MSISGVFFTNKGRILQAKAQTGTPLHFTRIAIGDGELQGQAPQTLNTLVSEKLSIEITKLVTGEDGTAKIGGSFNNSNLDTGFYYRELGLFVRDPDDSMKEILYCYGHAGALADYIPAQGSELIEKKIDIIAIIGNATNVSATINSSLISLSPEDLEIHDKDPEAHKPIREWVLSLFNNLNVSSDVEEVVNRRLNTDTSKPLGALISGWVDTAKTAVLNSITTLTNHVTSQHTTTKNHVTSQHTTTKNHVTTKVDALPQKSVWTDARAALLDKLSNLNQSLSGTQTNIINAINTARDNIKNHITSAIEPLINGNKVYAPSATVRQTLLNYESISSASPGVKFGTFRATRDGIVRMVIRVYPNYSSDGMILLKSATDPSVSASISTNNGNHVISPPYQDVPVNSVFGSRIHDCIVSVPSSNKNWQTHTIEVRVHRGQYLTIGGMYCKCNLLQICYDEVAN